jgi:hypothetical protein
METSGDFPRLGPARHPLGGFHQLNVTLKGRGFNRAVDVANPRRL